MKFSGHETFPVREGWLHKGVKLVYEKPEMFLHDEVSDTLGVGRNMAKSIRHWLVVTGLAESHRLAGKDREPVLRLTKFGELIWEFDPYFLAPGTWWMLHTNLVNNAESATTWNWFFNNFNHDRFDRAVCLESLRRFVESSRSKVPTISTLSRDLGCLLLSYSRMIPSGNDDPEDGADSPFRELGLLSYYRTSGYFRIDHSSKDLSPFVLGYAMSRAFPFSDTLAKKSDVRLLDVIKTSGGPGRVFCLNGESLFETISKAESISENLIQITGLAGDRAIRIRNLESNEWAGLYFKSAAENSHV
jgi:Protein of unknown function (DUF4007)